MPHIKVCVKCKRELPATAEYFHRESMTKDGLRCRCKVCRREEIRKYHQSEEGKSVARKRNLINAHGSDAVRLFNSFFERQGGCCAGCGKHQSQLKGRLQLDHDHQTGEYRGLLCFRCNSRAGSSEKDILSLKKLVKYLENFYAR